MNLKHVLTALFIPLMGTAHAETVYIENYFLAKKLEEIVPNCIENRELDTECADLSTITTLVMDDQSLLEIAEDPEFTYLHQENLNGLQYLTELNSFSLSIYIDNFEAREEEIPLKIETVTLRAEKSQYTIVEYGEQMYLRVGGLPNSVKRLEIYSGDETSDNFSVVEVYKGPNQLEELYENGVCYIELGSVWPTTLKKYTLNYTNGLRDLSNTYIEEFHISEGVWYAEDGEFSYNYFGDFPVDNLIFPTTAKKINLRISINNSSEEEHIPPVNFFKLNEGLEEFIIDYSEMNLLPALPNSLKKFEITNSIFDDQLLFNDGLESLKIVGSELTELPNNLPASLTSIDVSNNVLTFLPNLPAQLKTLNISRNPDMDCLPALPTSLTTLDITNTEISCIPNETNTIKATVTLPVCTEPCGEVPDFLMGLVFIDLNKNGVLDPTDSRVEGAFIQSGGKIITTNSVGEYSLYANPDTETKLSISYKHPHLDKILPAERTYTNSGNSTSVDTMNFAIQLRDVKDLEVLISPFTVRNGFTPTATVTVINRGTLPVTDFDLSLHAPLHWTFVSASPIAQSTTDSILWSNISLDYNTSRSFEVNLTVPATETIRTPFSLTAKTHQVANDETPQNNTYTFTSTIRGSYDPNDKLVYPESLAPGYAEGTELLYTVRFQNTGNDTAFTVVVKDTLQANLDPLSFRFISGTHPLVWSLNENGVITFTFANILLPDSNVNKPASNGQVTFAIQPKAGLGSGVSVENKAAIYFDFNAPIITNTATVKVALPTSVRERNNFTSKMYPNPAKNTTRVEWSESGKAYIALIDIAGRVIYQSATLNQYHDISLSRVNAGMYFVKVDIGNSSSINKLIVE